MNPKKKAVELVLKFSETTTQYDQAIKCALISVDEIISKCDCNNGYWQEVKKKIRKL
jgi:hypothetical protein